MTFATIRYDRDGAVGTVTLARPEALNAYSLQMRDDLFEAFTNAAQDPELRVLLIRGEGRAFCAGGDLTEFGTAPSPFQARRIRFARDNWAAVRGFPVPTIAAMHGHVIGTGLELALHCTIRIAGRSARLRMPETAIGLLPAAGGTQTLPRVAGTRLTAEMLYLGEAIDAERAARAGLVDRVLDDERLEEASRELAAGLSRRSRDQLRALTRMLRLRDEMGLHQAIRHEALISGVVSGT